jgi:hypothetical protein
LLTSLLTRVIWVRVDAGGAVVGVRAGLERHDNFFHGGIASAFADAVDGHFGLTRPGLDSGQCVGGRQPQVIMAMHRNGNPVVHAGRVFDDSVNQRAELFRGRIANGIRDVQGGGPGADGFTQYHVQEFGVRAAAVFGAEFDIFAQRTGVTDHFVNLVDHFFWVHLQLVFHVDGRSRQEGVDARMSGVLDGLPRGVDVIFGGSCQPADDRRFRPVAGVAHFNRNPADGFQIVR